MLQKEQPGRHLKNLRNYLCNKKDEKNSEILQGLNNHTVLWDWTCHWNYIFCTPIWFFPLKRWEPSPTKVGKDSTRTFPKRKGYKGENGVQIFWLTTAGILYWRHQMANMSQKKAKRVFEDEFISTEITIYRDTGHFWIWCSSDRASWKILITRLSRWTNFSNLFWNKSLHVSDSSSVHFQEFFTVHTTMVYVIQVYWQLANRIRTAVLMLLASC